MRILAFDGRMGASGDMLLGSLLAAGADRDALAPVEAALDLEYEAREVTKRGIGATAVDVVLPGEQSEEGGTNHDQSHGHNGHDDDHPHGHDHSHDHDHHEGEGGHDHEEEHVDGSHPAEGHGPHRGYGEVVEIVESIDLPADVEADALSIFELLGEAEAAVHGTDLVETQFHEVGADDAIADVVGAALLLADLDPDRVVTTPLATGGGEVSMSHGRYPIPAPAVVEIAERADWSLRGGPVEAELLTPTGAAILGHVANGVERLPTISVDDSGYGAGSKNFDEHPNVLRALVGESADDLRREPITVLETNLDDATPEVLGDLQESLSAAGALDVSIAPLTMKKARPGHLVKVICAPEDADAVARRLAVETGTLGIREHGSGHRWVADRERRTVSLTVDGETHDVDVKVASAGEAVYDVSAEYEDARAVARATDLPVREVVRRAETAARPVEE